MNGSAGGETRVRSSLRERRRLNRMRRAGTGIGGRDRDFRIGRPGAGSRKERALGLHRRERRRAGAIGRRHVAMMLAIAAAACGQSGRGIGERQGGDQRQAEHREQKRG